MINLIKNNYINKNGFYIIDEKSPLVIDIEEGVSIGVFLSDLDTPYTFNLNKNSRLDFYGFFTKTTPPKILFNQVYDNSILKVNALFFNNKDNLSTNIKSYINSNNSFSNIDIINIIKYGKIYMDSSIEIEEKTKKIKASLTQKNIFIGNEGAVRGLPTLLVKSNDIQASHSCQVERIDKNKLFYITSRGIIEKEAVSMIVSSYFTNTFNCMKMYDRNIYDDIYNNFLKLV